MDFDRNRFEFVMDFERDRIRLESPIDCIFFAQFIDTTGPRIVAQSPRRYITNEVFMSLNEFLTPRAKLCGQQINVNALNMKILGYPILLRDATYPINNEIIFNLCFVCSNLPQLRSIQYEKMVRKLNDSYFKRWEMESKFISNGANERQIFEILHEIKTQLNDNGFCELVLTDTRVINLRKLEIKPEPIEVQEHDVPIFLMEEETRELIIRENRDITVTAILPYIHGYYHVKRIADETDIPVTIVKCCIQQLIYFDVVAVQSMFVYSNTYVTAPNIAQLYHSIALQEECLEYVWNRGTRRLPTFSLVFGLYIAMQNGFTIRNLCEQFRPNRSGIDERKLVRFGLQKGLIRRVEKYPIYLGPKPVEFHHSFFDGNHSYDQICCATNRSHTYLDRYVDGNQRIIVCCK